MICEELVVYKIWPVSNVHHSSRVDGSLTIRYQANCWFLVSLLQQHLQGDEIGCFMDGSLKWGSTARRVRARVKERLRSIYHIPLSFSVRTTLFPRSARDHRSHRCDYRLKISYSRSNLEPVPRCKHFSQRLWCVIHPAPLSVGVSFVLIFLLIHIVPECLDNKPRCAEHLCINQFWSPSCGSLGPDRRQLAGLGSPSQADVDPTANCRY